MKVFKFGGASISDYERIRNLPSILESFKDEKILIVISAMGKMTNALEKVAIAFYEERKEDALGLFQKIKNKHLDLLKYLVTLHWKECEERLNDLFTEVEWMLHDKPVKDFNYYYDQIVCVGELLSSTLISFFLNETNLPNQWIDVRDLLRTDDNFRDAKIDWDYSQKTVSEKLIPFFHKYNFVITQGFIAGTDENESTTFGREGSDYTAAIFARLLNAESVAIWKDVNGIMNADPKELKEAINLSELSYKEVIEMAYYGAKVIHPKTIKPLQNKGIPLFVRSFIDPGLSGTHISKKQVNHLPPIIVQKKNQVLITFESTDFSFVEGEPMNYLNSIFSELNIKANLSQNTAISFMICIDDVDGITEELALKASMLFEVQLQKKLELLTIRHYDKETIELMTGDKKIILTQKTTETIQLLIELPRL